MQTVSRVQASLTWVYDGLGADDAAFVHEAAERISEHGRRMVAEVVAIGEDLLAVKARLHHGRFGQWVASEFAMSQDSAERFMNVARLVRDFPQAADFRGPLETLYKLAAPSTSENVRRAVLAGAVSPALGNVKRAQMWDTTAQTQSLDRSFSEFAGKMLHGGAVETLRAGYGYVPPPNWDAASGTVISREDFSPVRQAQCASRAFRELLAFEPSPVLLAAMLSDLMDIKDAAVSAPDVQALVQGLRNRPRRQVVAAQWAAALQQAITLAQAEGD